MRTMKVLLIDLPYPRKLEDKTFNAGLGYLAGSLKIASHQVRVLDFQNNPLRIDERLKEALAEKPDMVGLPVSTLTKKIAVEIAKRVREIARPSLLVAGGAHLSVDGFNFMKANAIFDVGVRGEGEHTILELCEVVEGIKRLEDIEGIIFRREGIVFQTPPRKFIEDLDSLAYPDYAVFDSNCDNIPYSLVINRGCPFNCSFCCVRTVMGSHLRQRDVNKVIKEIESIQHKYSRSGFRAIGDNLTCDIGKTKMFCDLLCASNIKLSWDAINVRADAVDSELLIKAKAAGCRKVIFGVESGDMKVFSMIGKGETLKDIERAVKLAKEAGLNVVANLVIGLPGSTFESELQSIKFVQRLKINYSMFRHCLPFPGTPLYEWCKKNARFIVAYDEWQDWSYPFFETDLFSKKERIKAYFVCNLRMRQYNVLLDPSVRGIMRKIYILFLLLKYDSSSLPKEFLRLFKKYLWGNTRSHPEYGS